MASLTDFDRELDDVVKDNYQKKNATRQTSRNLRTGISRPFNNRGNIGKLPPRNSYKNSSSKPPYSNPRSYSSNSTNNQRQSTFRDQLQSHNRSRSIGLNSSSNLDDRVVDRDGGLTRVLISNLDYGVTLEDIKELYGEFGRTTRMVVNFDKSGRSLGTAEIVYERRGDALKAMQTYNGIPLDGKTMCVEVVSNDHRVAGADAGASSRLRGSERRENNYRANGHYAISYAHSIKAKSGHTDYDNPKNHRDNNPFFRPSFSKDQNLKKPIKSPRETNESKTAEELDKELDKYLMTKKD